MNKEKCNYSPISVIDCEQILIRRYPRLTNFSFKMYENFRNSSHEKKYYEGINYDSTYQCENDIASYVLLKSYYRNNNGTEDYCLGSRVMSNYEMRQGEQDYRIRPIGKQYGIVPTIPYKYVSEIAKKYKEMVVRYDDYYALGYYPSTKIDFNKTLFYVDLIDDSCCFKDYSYDVVPKESEFNITDEKFSFPITIDDKLELENYNVYRATTKNGVEIKAIKYNDEWFRIDPVIWKKIGDNLVCTNILFESPVHMKNDYVKDSNIQSLDDTFLKWYVDNVFIKDLFKYTDLSFMKEQMNLGIDENIDSKMKEIERLKQIKADLILQSQSEYHIIDTARRNISNLLEKDNKEQSVRTSHK